MYLAEELAVPVYREPSLYCRHVYVLSKFEVCFCILRRIFSHLLHLHSHINDIRLCLGTLTLKRRFVHCDIKYRRNLGRYRCRRGVKHTCLLAPQSSCITVCETHSLCHAHHSCNESSLSDSSAFCLTSRTFINSSENIVSCIEVKADDRSRHSRVKVISLRECLLYTTSDKQSTRCHDIFFCDGRIISICTVIERDHIAGKARRDSNNSINLSRIFS